jgi:hypothetical protein
VRKFFLTEGVLYRRSKEGMHQRVVVETSEREAVLRGVHENLGHRGLFSTRRTLLDRYWWPSVNNDVLVWVKGCDKCQAFSDRKIVLPIEPSSPTQLFRRFGVDLMRMPKSRGYTNIVLARDLATGYPEGRPLRNATMTAVANFLFENIVCRWGAIEELRTDNGPEFQSVVEEMMRWYGIRHIRISLYNSRANGLVEQGHHLFRRMLLKTCGDPSDWMKTFHATLWADRATVRKETGYSSFFLAHGYQPLLPVEAYRLTFGWNAGPKTHQELVVERVRMLERRDEDEVKVLERIAKSRWQNKERFEKEHANTVFEGTYAPGTLVLIRNSPVEKELDRKHKPRWLGPMVVIRRTKGGSYILAEEDGTISQTRYAAFRVVRYHLREGLSFKLGDFVDDDQVKRLEQQLVTEDENSETGVVNGENDEENKIRGRAEEEGAREHGAPPPEAITREAPLPLLPLPRIDDTLPVKVRPTRKFLGVTPPKLILKRVAREES